MVCYAPICIYCSFNLTFYRVDFDDFDAIANTDPMNNLLLKKNIVKKPTNRTRRSRNPVKALANRTDIKNTYNQHDKTANILISSADSSEEGGPKKEKNVHSHLAAEAKAALAATEDFSSVQLKKDNKVVPNAEFVPYKAQGTYIL